MKFLNNSFVNILNHVSKSSVSLNVQRQIRKNAFRPWVIKSLPKPSKTSDDPIIQRARKSFGKTIIPEELAELRFAYPEFLPITNPEYRNPVYEMIVREDMIKRRMNIDIPEFYVGTIMAVTIADHWASGKLSKFVGICIERNGQGTFANFTLRNRVNGQGVEIRYDLYNPCIQEIQVLKLEKRIDEHLLYLRDALPEYSEIPFDLAPEPPRKPGEPIPVNTIQVEMKPWPWTVRWEYQNLQGIKKLPNMPDYNYIKIWKHQNELEKFDLMNEYRNHIPEDQQLSIWKQVQKYQKSVKNSQEIERRRKLIK